MFQSPLFPNLGLGLGLRRPHYMDVMAGRSKAQWFEVITENHMGLGKNQEGRPNLILEKVRSHYPVVFHGVSLSIGGTDPLNKKYLSHLKELIEMFEPAWVSDHLCWTGVGGQNLHDLLPLPYTQEALELVVERINRVQDFLGRRILLENVSSYMSFTSSEMQEWEFLAAISKLSDCALLLDINNVYVSSVNHQFDAKKYLNAIDPERVVQIHMAGHIEREGLLLDTHDQPLKKEVLNLYNYFVEKNGSRSTMIEWDEHVPPLNVLEKELDKLAHANSKTKTFAQKATEANLSSY